MDSSFWNGFLLHNLLFKHVHISSPLELVGVCLITSAIAFTFEGTRTLRDWLYIEFLKKRSCDEVSKNDTPLVLREMKHENCHTGNTQVKSSKVNSNGESQSYLAPENAKRKTEAEINSNSSVNKSGTPVIATGTISGPGKDCKKPSFQVGLLELSCSTLLHMMQVILGYVLMLVVMTFNVWIFFAVLAGTTVGFFVFDGLNKKINSLKLNSNNAK